MSQGWQNQATKTSAELAKKRVPRNLTDYAAWCLIVVSSDMILYANFDSIMMLINKSS